MRSLNLFLGVSITHSLKLILFLFCRRSISHLSRINASNEQDDLPREREYFEFEMSTKGLK